MEVRTAKSVIIATDVLCVTAVLVCGEAPKKVVWRSVQSCILRHLVYVCMAAKAAKTTFGAEVRKLRILAGMSLRHLARRVGISPVYLSDIENNRKPAPSAEILQAVMSVLHADHDEFIRLAMKSVEDYGCVARKPRMSEQLSTDEYLLIMRKKQMLEPEEFKSWLAMTSVSNPRGERKIRQHLRGVVVARLLKPTQPALDFEAAVSAGLSVCNSSIPVSSASVGQALRGDRPNLLFINHYEGQSEKEALEIYIDTCYKEWRSIKSEFARGRYVASLEQCTYMLRPIALSSSAFTEPD